MGVVLLPLNIAEKKPALYQLFIKTNNLPLWNAKAIIMVPRDNR
jgi:hypothetical protein